MTNSTDVMTPGQVKDMEQAITKWGNKFIGLGMVAGMILGSVTTFIVLSLNSIGFCS